MAEIQMDVDTSKPGGLDSHIDEDLIDFDTDMVDQHDGASLHDGHLQKHDDITEAMDRDMEEYDDDPADYASYKTNGTLGDDVDFELHDIEDATHTLDEADHEVSEAHGHQDHESPEADQPSNKDAHEQDEYSVEIPNEIDNHDHAAAQDDHASAHEIDYELEDHVEQEESRTESHENPTIEESGHSVDPSTSESAGNTAEDILPLSGDTTDLPEQDVSNEHLHQIEDHETSLKEIEEHELQEAAPEQDGNVGLCSVDEAVVDELDDTAHGDGESHDGENTVGLEETIAHEVESNHGDTVGVGDVENIGHDMVEGDAEEHNNDEVAGTEDANHSTTGEDTEVKSGTDFPAITVQYKGDEFPLFSTTTDAFFADTTILDEPLEKLLAGLRSELENEIAEDDELVLQVDELGIEIAEVRTRSPYSLSQGSADKKQQSTQGELMTDISFRQILEIFDLLVKNQDPDGSRTLYTYLFTKPDTEKRLESLIESAAAGKGLDEVIHLFQSPMLAAPSMLEADDAVNGLHEELDGFDSPLDEEHTSETKNAEPDEEYAGGDDPETGASAPQNDEGDEQFDDEVAAEPATEVHNEDLTLDETTHSEPDAVAADENSGQNGNAASLSSNFFTCHYPDFCLCTPCVAEYVADHNREETAYRHTLGIEQNPEYNAERIPTRFEKSYLECVRKKHAQSYSDFSTTFSHQEADDFLPARAGSEADNETDPFVNLELDEGVEVDLEDDVVGEEHVVVEADAARAETNDTSTTTTLKDEDEAGYLNVDLGAATGEDTTVEKTGPREENDLDEIDWRDEPEAEGPITPAAGKRARGDDDEVDAEDEQVTPVSTPTARFPIPSWKQHLARVERETDNLAFCLGLGPHLDSKPHDAFPGGKNHDSL
ncbi:hypothetical protein FZEAL_829 [Fusarium zealandicum]|uniref:Uncharacterized protein n=1 Tax=Fusarium zealandicum TaxID=1053134 RepID=A0A8H4XPE0_9HYPO|nr:hypothetical protein FZEAL_829 [Fusarium zealandicum]